MKGGIYSDQKCRVCGGAFRDNGRDGLTCPAHPKRRATRFLVRFGRDLSRRFPNYRSAERFLTGLRYKCDEGSFDLRDYRSENPLGFSNLAERWLSVKQTEVKPGTYSNLANYMTRAMAEWGQQNIREIGYADIEDFLLLPRSERTKKPLSPKTRSNMRSALHDFWTWLRKRRVLTQDQIPEFPEIRFELGFRNTVSKDVQEAILDEIHKISFHIDPKVWLGTKWLCTYISIRPGEMRRVKEKHLNLNEGFLLIPHPKEKKPKFVPLIEEDVDLVRKLPRGFPEMPFFRHPPGISGCRAGQAFGGKYLYKWWKRACKNLGIEGVDLYGGTRHSSAIALGKLRTPEEIKRATMHSTNKAFERYFRIETEDLRDIYRDTVRSEDRGRCLDFNKKS